MLILTLGISISASATNEMVNESYRVSEDNLPKKCFDIIKNGGSSKANELAKIKDNSQIKDLLGAKELEVNSYFSNGYAPSSYLVRAMNSRKNQSVVVHFDSCETIFEIHKVEE